MPTCENCSREFMNNAGLGSHKRVCDGKPFVPYVKWSCPKCGYYVHSKKERHVEICDGLGPGAHRRAALKGTGKGWNKGIKASEEMRKKISESLRGKPWKPTSVEIEAERRRKISEKMKRNPDAGGYRKGSGVGKGGWYDSPIAGRVYLDSTFEFRFAKCADSMSIQWERNKEKFPYEHEGKSHYYIPDFKVANTFIEVKGYITERDKSKWKNFPHELVILRETDIINLEIGELPKWS